MMLPAQVLYNLRDCSAWISGTDLHDLFRTLVDDPSPSGGMLFDTSQLDETAQVMLEQTEYAVVFDPPYEPPHKIWRFVKGSMTIVQATELAWRFNRRDGSYEENGHAKVVPMVAAAILVGTSVKDVDFSDGYVTFPGSSHHNVIPAWPGYDVSDSRNHLKQTWGLWHNAGLGNLVEQFVEEIEG